MANGRSRMASDQGATVPTCSPARLSGIRLHGVRKWAWRIIVSASCLLLAGMLAMWARAQWAGDQFIFTTRAGRTDEARLTELRMVGSPSSLALGVADVTIRAETPTETATLLRDLLSEMGFSHYPWYSALGRWPLEKPAWQGFAASRFDTREAPDPDGYFETVNGNFYPVRAIARRVEAPYWFLALCFSLAPARALWTWRKNSRHQPHACPDCGYDLRATPVPTGPLLPTCPECGRPTAAASASD
jgi:hypothetical protein